MEVGSGQQGVFRRVAPSIVSALLLLLPLIAKQLTSEVNWDENDFIVFGAMLFGGCGLYELASTMTPNFACREAVGVAVVAAILFIWMNLAVGIIGSEDIPANLIYAAVLAVTMAGACILRFQAHGMSKVLLATAFAQALVGFAALVAGLGATGANWPRVIIAVTGSFVALCLLSAWLFWKAELG
jgi:hypothetical protein